MEPVSPTHSFLGLYCGIASLQGSVIVVCLIWIGASIYSCYSCFQGGGGIFFSYLPHAATVFQGVVALIFILGALFALLALILARPTILMIAHRLMWTIVGIFTVDMFVNVVLFGAQRDQFHDWCIDQSRASISQKISTDYDNGAQTHVNFTSGPTSDDLYNCNKLWEDEVKFSVIAIVVITIFNIYSAACLWSFSQKTTALQRQELILQSVHGQPYTQSLHNLGKRERDAENHSSSDGGRSMAQISSQLIDKLFKKRNK